MHVATAPDGHTSDATSLRCVGTGRLVLTSRTLHLNTTEELGSIRLIVGYNWGRCSRYMSAQIIACMYCVVSAASLLLLNEFPSCANFCFCLSIVLDFCLFLFVFALISFVSLHLLCASLHLVCLSTPALFLSIYLGRRIKRAIKRRRQ